MPPSHVVIDDLRNKTYHACYFSGEGLRAAVARTPGQRRANLASRFNKPVFVTRRVLGKARNFLTGEKAPPQPPKHEPARLCGGRRRTSPLTRAAARDRGEREEAADPLRGPGGREPGQGPPAGGVRRRPRASDCMEALVRRTGWSPVRRHGVRGRRQGLRSRRAQEHLPASRSRRPRRTRRGRGALRCEDEDGRGDIQRNHHHQYSNCSLWYFYFTRQNLRAVLGP